MVEQVKPKREDYIECPECSRIYGKPTIYPKYALESDTEIFGEEGQLLCPKGHVVPKAAA